MSQANTQAIALPRTGTESVLATNTVIRNTYLLLSMTLLFAAAHRRRLGGTEAAASRVDRDPGRLLRPALPHQPAAQQRLGRGLGVRPDRIHGLHPGADHRSLPRPGQWRPDGDDGHGRHGDDLRRSVGLRADDAQGLQLHGRLPDGRRAARFPGRAGGHLLRDSGPVADRLGGLRAADVGADPVRNLEHHPRWRNQLRDGHGDCCFRRHLQPLHQPAAPAGFHEPWPTS
jgi:hypothetical protein